MIDPASPSEAGPRARHMLARHGTFARAAAASRTKRHLPPSSACAEDAGGAERRRPRSAAGYRTATHRAGHACAEHARELLSTRASSRGRLRRDPRTVGSPSCLVFDGISPVEPIRGRLRSPSRGPAPPRAWTSRPSSSPAWGARSWTPTPTSSVTVITRKPPTSALVRLAPIRPAPRAPATPSRASAGTSSQAISRRTSCSRCAARTRGSPQHGRHRRRRSRSA